MSVAWRQTKGLALLNSTDNNCAFCIHEKSPIIYWFSLTLCLGDLRLPLIPITGNTVPLSRETISHLSAQQENMRKHLSGPEELMTLWCKSAPPPSFCLPSLTLALLLCQPSLWPLGGRGGRVAVVVWSQLNSRVNLIIRGYVRNWIVLRPWETLFSHAAVGDICGIHR